MKRVRQMTLAALVAGCLGGCAPAPQPGVTVLTYASQYTPTHPFSRADAEWMKWIEERSRGRIRIKPYWSGSVLSSEHSMTEIRHGVVDIGLITPIYARGGAHLIRVQAAFYAGLTTYEQQTALYRCLTSAHSQFATELAGLHVLAVQGGNLPGILTRNRRVTSLDDLRGLRLRAPAELIEVLRRFDADPVEMPMGEVYSALAKGVLDGVVAPADTLKSLHFAEVADYFYMLEVPRGAYAARAIGAARWASLSDEERQILDEGVPVWEHALEAQLRSAQSSGEQLGRQHGLTFSAPAAADTERFLRVYNEVATEAAAKAQRFDVDGVTPFNHARKVVARTMQTGRVECTGENP